MLRPFVRRLREFGHTALMYIDAGISGDAQKQVAYNNYSSIVSSDLNLSGWKPAINRELKICNAAARRRAFKTKNIFIEDNTYE